MTQYIHLYITNRFLLLCINKLLKLTYKPTILMLDIIFNIVERSDHVFVQFGELIFDLFLTVFHWILASQIKYLNT